MNIETILIKSSSGVTAHNKLFHHESGTDKLLVILPGRGYLSEHPVLYYLRVAGLELGYDVLSIQYGFQAAQTDLTDEGQAQLMDEANRALQPMLARGYRRVCLAGKSLGTPLAVSLAPSLNAAEKSLILLTPVGGAVHLTGDLRALAIIGTADALYSADEIAAFKDHPTIQWLVLEGLNHGLEAPGDWLASLRALGEITRACAAFLQ
jgi:predicted alpha/beta-hydrolase family hydrolase